MLRNLPWRSTRMYKLAVIPIFIPHKGCPFDCIYCNQKLISGQISEVTVTEMKTIVELHLNTISKDSTVEIAFYGGSFTGIEKEQQLRFLELANEYISDGRVKAIRLSTRPDYISREILEYLKNYNVKTIELGVQSLDEEVLQKSCRGHSISDVLSACSLIKEFGFVLGIQTMIGLPGDTRDKDIETARKVIELSPQIVRIYPTLVIKDTFLEKMYHSGKYIPLNLDEAVGICAELLDMYESNNIKVIRIGLQTTDKINEEADVVAGPFHPAFRELVESRLMLDCVEEQINENNLTDVKNIFIKTDEKFISKVIGQKRSNIEYLRKKYNFSNISIMIDKNLKSKVLVTKSQ